MLEVLDSYDWKEAFGFAGESDTCNGTDFHIEGCNPVGTYDLSPFTREDVDEIYHLSDGEKDVMNWIVYGKLKDGRFFYLSAGCDSTGWDCREWGGAEIGSSREEIERFSLSDEDRWRLGITLN